MEPPRDDGEAKAPPAAAAAEARPFAVGSHRALFTAPGEVKCDACGGAVPAPGDGGGEDEGYRLAGEGVYMWTRGDQVRFEKAPLCPECASAIGVTALGRWEIEEEEG